MRIALDCMGGDVGLPVNIKGAVSAVRQQKDIEIILVGRGADISKELAGCDADGLNLVIEDTPEVVEMSESPSSVIRKKGLNRAKPRDLGFGYAGSNHPAPVDP